MLKHYHNANQQASSQGILSDKFIFNFCLIIYFITVLILIYNCYKPNEWVIGDWLINFQDGGFKRRGLGGSLIFFLQNQLNLSLKLLVTLLNLAIYSVFFYCFYKILLFSKPHFLIISLLTSPVLFLLYVKDKAVVGRKEILIYTIFSSLAVQLLRYQRISNFSYLIFGSLLTVSVLLHEMTVFFIPYFFLLLHIKKQKISTYTFLYLFIFPATAGVIIFLFGSKINEGTSLSIFLNRGLDLTASPGIFSFDESHLLGELSFIMTEKWNYLGYIISALLAIIYFYIYFNLFRKIEQNTGITASIGILFCFLFSSPLFILGSDWGRWLSIHCFLSLILLLLIDKPKTQIEIQKDLKLSPRALFAALLLLNACWRMKGWNNGLDFGF